MQERPDLAEEKARLVVEGAGVKRIEAGYTCHPQTTCLGCQHARHADRLQPCGQLFQNPTAGAENKEQLEITENKILDATRS